ncbi:MAG: PEGA domain-containing protein, partial [Bradymonadaceae bacterium]
DEDVLLAEGVEDVDDAGEEEGTEDEGLVWDQDEMETEIFDRSDDRPEGLPPEPVLPEPGGEPGAEGEGAVEVVGPDDQVDVIEKDDGQGAVAEPGAPVGAADAASSAESTPAADTPAGGAQPPPTPEGVAEVESGGGTARVDRRTSEQVPEAEPRQPAAKKADETGGDDGAFWTYLTAGMALLAVAAFAWVGVRVLSGPGPNETSVTFDTTPSSVTITVDGKRVYRGTTPYTHVFEPGDDPTEIAVKKEGYRTKREVRTFRTDQRYKVDWELTEKPDETQKRVASLKVKTEPPGASVRVDGEVREGKTPVTIGELEPGNHDVQVSLEGWESRERSVDVRVDEEKTLSLELKPTAVSLEVDSEPQGAYFSVYTQADDERVGSGQTPATVEKLEPGASYRVVVERDGYQRWTETVELDAESASAEVTADLQKREEPEPVASAETTSESSESPSESSGSTSPSDEGGRRSKSNDGVSGGPSEETGSTAGGSPGGETST